MSVNVEDLRSYIDSIPMDMTADIATSQYAMNTVPKGYCFDFWSTAAAVRSLVKQGRIEAEYKWRYYEVKRVS